jgi:hypothetical protein
MSITVLELMNHLAHTTFEKEDGADSVYSQRRIPTGSA